MADSLQHRITEYDELSKLQQRFVSDVSHELRTPLTTIRMAEVMIWKDRDNLSPSTKRSAELLHEQVERFDSMLADLLEISRYDARSALLDAESTDLRALAAKVVNDHSELAERLNVPIIIHNPENRCDAEIDSRRVERVVRNLVVNAIEHAERRAVDIDIAATDTDVALRVHDHGVGMSEETVSHVFDRFFRADPARTRTTGGTGLGLAIAREDINLHGGTIEAWGVPGAGSSFVITLPRKVAQPWHPARWNFGRMNGARGARMVRPKEARRNEAESNRACMRCAAPVSRFARLAVAGPYACTRMRNRHCDGIVSCCLLSVADCQLAPPVRRSHAISRTG